MYTDAHQVLRFAKPVRSVYTDRAGFVLHNPYFSWENQTRVSIEVQGYADPQFAHRMYQYAYRIEDRYQRPLTALVIYTDTDRPYHFSEYKSSFFGTELSYRFRTFILMDHSADDLRRSDNAFALVLEVARRDLEIRKKSDASRLESKIELARHLLNEEWA